jgi:hypothetical protein
MEFIEKTRVCSSLAAAEHIAADKALLRTVQPGDSLLHSVGKGKDLDKQILWVLLDFCSADEINASRTNSPRPPAPNASSVTNAPHSKIDSPPEKKNVKKRTNIQILNGITSKMTQYKKRLSSIMTG